MTTPTKAEVLALYSTLLAQAKVHKDSKGNGNEDPELCAFNGLRTDVHFYLQQGKPPPGPHEDDEGDPELHHARQKRHFKALWKQADAIIAAAGITAKGVTP